MRLLSIVTKVEQGFVGFFLVESPCWNPNYVKIGLIQITEAATFFFTNCCCLSEHNLTANTGPIQPSVMALLKEYMLLQIRHALCERRTCFALLE